MDIRYCPKCGSEIKGDKDRCDNCGYDLSMFKEDGERDVSTVYLLKKKDPTLAGILSFIFPGLGQIYVGDIGRGILVMAIAFIIALVAVLTNILLYVVYHAIQIYDAYREANRYNSLLLEGIVPW